MVFFNYSTKEITGKIVYYGPGLCGKTTNLQYIYKKLDPSTKGKMLSLATEADRTLFFDFLPVKLGTIRGMKVRFQLYTVPGQVFYNETRKLVLKGADAIVFVADSQKAMMDANIESYTNMEENLRLNGLDPDTIPLILQYNKRDLPDISSVNELNQELIHRGDVTFLEASAIKGEGVVETFQSIGKLLMNDIVKKYKTKAIPAVEKKPTPEKKAAKAPVAASVTIEDEHPHEIELDENLETEEHEIELEEEPGENSLGDEASEYEYAEGFTVEHELEQLKKQTPVKKAKDTRIPVKKDTPTPAPVKSETPVKIPAVIDTSAIKRERQEFEEALKLQVDGIQNKMETLEQTLQNLQKDIVSLKESLADFGDSLPGKFNLGELQRRILVEIENKKNEIMEHLPAVKKSWLSNQIFYHDK
ncbi:GTPase domain-containing protein [bacterium]|nr:GTPase domain-containing protein [bacterium]